MESTKSKVKEWKEGIKVTSPNEMEKYSLYSDYISGQRKGFTEIIRIIDDAITELQDDGELTGYVKINARIKSTESALNNDDKDNKTLNDVFGIEVLAGNEVALKKIMKKIEEYMNIRKEHLHDKDNGYKAMHKMGDIKKEVFEKLGQGSTTHEHTPLVELQFKTFEVKENAISGPANHWEYKGQSKEEIQEIYNRNGFNEHNLPIMYTVENHKIRILSKQETIRELYPFLKFRSNQKGVEK